MRAVVVRGVEDVAIETVEDPRIESPMDIIMRVTSSAICGPDLHMYEGRMGDIVGMVIGHEPLGVVEEVGPAIVIHALAQIINPTGRLGIVGVFLPHDARPNSDLEARGDLAVPWPQLFAKGIVIGMGRDHDERYNAHLRDLIIAGRAKPSVVVTQRLPLSSAPAAFRTFDQREDGYAKVVLDPAARA